HSFGFQPMRLISGFETGSKLYDNFKENILSILFTELVKSFSQNDIENAIFTDLFSELDENISSYNSMVAEKKQLTIMDTASDEIIAKKYAQENKIFNYIVCLSYCFKERNAKEILSKLFNLFRFPYFNRDELKQALNLIVGKVSDDELDELFKDTKLGLEDQLFVFEIIMDDRKINDFRFNKFKKLLNKYFEIGRPDKLIDSIKLFWSGEVFDLIIAELKLLDSKKRGHFDRPESMLFFKDINYFIINEIICDNREVNLTRLMPIEFDDGTHQKIKGIFSFWNSCFGQRKYTF
ncbi:MAG: hypothetical protein K8R21_09595, partial [Leptospira sp.]|nr:hypothetical protein [Leptospira sp.]